MKKIKREDIKVVLANPERLPYLQRNLMEFLYEEYLKSDQGQKFINETIKDNKM